MGMSKSTYYYEISKVDVVAERNKELADEIKEIFEHHKGRYGVRRVHQELANNGRRVNHKRVQRLMHNMGLLGKRPKEKYREYPKDCVNLQTNVRYNYSVWRFLKWQEKRIHHKKQ